MQNGTLDAKGLAKSGKTNGLMGTGPSLACQDSPGQVSGQVWNQNDPFLLVKPRPAANTKFDTYYLLTKEKTWL